MRAETPGEWFPLGECVYFIRAEDETGLIKIGYSRDLARRMANLQQASPSPLRLIGYIRRAGHLTEQSLHAYFEADRAHGEWFRPSAELAAFATGNAVITAGGQFRYVIVAAKDDVL